MNKLTTAVWEITMGCNMRCKHCGSSCAEALPDELNTSEALEVCDQLKDLGLKVITLSGGEPTTLNNLNYQVVQFYLTLYLVPQSIHAWPHGHHFYH